MTFVNKKKTIVMKSKNSKPSYFIRVCFFVVNSVLSTYGNAQVITDSLANDIRSFAARNISRYRTLNLYWETKGTHSYSLRMNGKNIERGRRNDLHTIKFSTMFPILKQKNISLYANLQ